MDKPSLIENPDLTALKYLVREIVNKIDSKEISKVEINKYEVFICKVVIETFYGVEVYAWMDGLKLKDSDD